MPLAIGYVMQADAVDMATVSGPQLHVKAVIEGLRRRGHSVRAVAIQRGRTVWSDDLVDWQSGVFGFSSSPWFRVPERAVRRAQRQLRLPFLRLCDSYRFSDACVAALRGCDVLYERFGFLSYGGLIASRRLGIPIIYEVNGDLVEEFAINRVPVSSIQWWIIHFVSRRMFQRAGHVVAVNETLRDKIMRRWRVDADRVTAVPNGANLELFQNPTEVAVARARSMVGDGPAIVFVSGFQPWHGIDLLLTAFARICRSHPAAVLVLAGDGPQRDSLARRASALGLGGRVLFTGLLANEDIAGLLSVCEIAVVNPRSSAMTRSQSSLKMFEYLAAGKAIVAPSLPEMAPFLTHGVNSLLVKPDDEEALADALAELIADAQMRARLGQAARRQAAERHSWDHTVGRLEEILYGVVRAQHRMLLTKPAR